MTQVPVSVGEKSKLFWWELMDGFVGDGEGEGGEMHGKRGDHDAGVGGGENGLGKKMGKTKNGYRGWFFTRKKLGDPQFLTQISSSFSISPSFSITYVKLFFGKGENGGGFARS